MGYDQDLKRLTKPADKDKIDDLIARAENPDWFRTIRDELN